MSNLLPIPNFAISDESRRVEAATAFSQLGRLLPAVSVSLDDIGLLADIDESAFTDRQKSHYKLTPTEQAVFHALVKRSFEFFGQRAVALDFTQLFEPYTFELGQSDVSAWIAYPNSTRRQGTSQLYAKKDGGVHNDSSYEGSGAVVYGAHLTTCGEGGLEAGIPTGVIYEGGLRFPRAKPLTHGRSLSAADMHIFVRQAPSTALYDASGSIIAPATHDFYTTNDSGRVHIQASYGIASEWPLAS